MFYWGAFKDLPHWETCEDPPIQVRPAGAESRELILSLEITTQLLERFKLSEPDLEGMDARPKTWVDLALLQVVGDLGPVDADEVALAPAAPAAAPAGRGRGRGRGAVI